MFTIRARRNHKTLTLKVGYLSSVGDVVDNAVNFICSVAPAKA